MPEKQNNVFEVQKMVFVLEDHLIAHFFQIWLEQNKPLPFTIRKTKTENLTGIVMTISNYDELEFFEIAAVKTGAKIYNITNK